VKLNKLLAREDVPDLEIGQLAIDSRQVLAGALFAAFPGSKTDGGAFITQAVERGATAIIAPASTTIVGAYHIVSDAPRALMANIAARFFARRPALRLAITGTNGKTSTVDMIRQILVYLGQSAASIGTLGVMYGDRRTEFGLTTPDVLTFHKTLAELADSGATALAFEASSHALDQHRISGTDIAVGSFSNLTQDHLDYHGNMEAYFEAKLLLLDLIAPGGTMVINMDDSYGTVFAARAGAKAIKIMRVGKAGEDVKLLRRQILLQAQHLTLSILAKPHDVVLPLVGAFQADNAIMAASMVIAAGFAASDVLDAVAHLQPVPGRLELAATTASGAAIYVDYAHTPDGLRAALEALRPHTQRQLHVVFGCGGDRDRGKRPKMAAVAGQLADQVIVTDDNPRTEDAVSIRAEVHSGFAPALNIGDRHAAIVQAITQAGSGDVVLVAGKGHEQGQIIGATVVPFDDVKVVRAIAQERAA
jgi:UDP-N-acetylmuramoyl-L-alanyl-D-glutamate--2,6-diaminopimelate ligase